MSLKLAVEFLMKGGTFVTKVFRSADLQQSYVGVLTSFSERWRPQSHRHLGSSMPYSLTGTSFSTPEQKFSAEIFVVCRDYLAPKKIDPKFLDPKHVFKELTASAPLDGKLTISANAQANVFQPDKTRRHRDGYAEGDHTLFKVIGATKFIRSSDPISVLGSANRIAFITDEEKE